MAAAPQENQKTHSQDGGFGPAKGEEVYNTHADSYDLPLHGAHDDEHAAGSEKNLSSSEEKVALRTLSTRTQPSDWNKFLCIV